ncbi:hypothetical protein Ddc_21539 [Ditylenchus destructor]|nr:hypothetical protein Ddc_21539 [Ditylenchus destructor]
MKGHSFEAKRPHPKSAPVPFLRSFAGHYFAPSGHLFNCFGIAAFVFVSWLVVVLSSKRLMAPQLECKAPPSNYVSGSPGSAPISGETCLGQPRSAPGQNYCRACVLYRSRFYSKLSLSNSCSNNHPQNSKMSSTEVGQKRGHADENGDSNDAIVTKAQKVDNGSNDNENVGAEVTNDKAPVEPAKGWFYLKL